MCKSYLFVNNLVLKKIPNNSNLLLCWRLRLLNYFKLKALKELFSKNLIYVQTTMNCYCISLFCILFNYHGL